MHNSFKRHTFVPIGTTIKKTIMKTEKSKYAKKVLTLMDADFTYTDAVRIVLHAFKNLSRVKLEKELSLYI